MEKLIPVQFSVNRKRVEVSLEALERAALTFLEHYGSSSFLGEPFFRIISPKDSAENRGGRENLDALLMAAGMNSFDFFTDLVRQLAESSHLSPVNVKVGVIEIPNRFLLAILEVLIPGEELVHVRSVEQFEELTNVSIPEQDRKELQQVIDTYPVRLSMHVIRQGRLSKHIAYQFMPFIEELDDSGVTNSWVGQFHRGLIEQMYQNRPIFVLHMSCPVYCRFCFRKHKDMRNQKAPTVEDVDRAIEYIRSSERIKEIVLTGGEPLLNKKTLTRAVEGLRDIPHIQTIRIASRCISYYPHLFYADNKFWLNYLLDTNRELAETGKRIEIATHFIHPDEISPAALEIISTLVSGGVQVYTQTPFLNNCNDNGNELTELYRELRGAGSELHYIYIPASPIKGNSVYWTPLSKGHKAFAYLRGHLSDRAMPILCTATRIGKIDWNASGWAVEQDEEEPRHIWIRTPYNSEYFSRFTPEFHADGVRENDHGTMDARFMAEAGDRQLFFGSFSDKEIFKRPFSQERLETIQGYLVKSRRIDESVVSTAVSSLYRTHLCRADVDIAKACENETEFQTVIDYIAREKELTDIVLSSKKSLLDQIEEISRFAEAISLIPHVNALRLRSTSFTYEPERYSDDLIDSLSALQQLDPADPTRVEIEAQFIHSSEFRDEHRRVIARFLSRGVTVYNNIILLSGINDSVDEMMKICYNCRQIGIELFQLYVAGLPVQKMVNSKEPVDATTIINIASSLRRYQSGREIPLYVVRTALGEADFNLNAIMVETGETSVAMKLLPYSLDYFRKMERSYSWPEGIREVDGHPVVEVDGLTVRTNREFFIRP